MVFINSEDSTSKTDQPQQWGKLSKVWKLMYKKGMQISDLFTTKRLKLDIQSLNHDEFIKNHNILTIPWSLSINISQEKHSEIDKTCQNVLNNVIDNLENHFITKKKIIIFIIIYNNSSTKTIKYLKIILCYVSIKF